MVAYALVPVKGLSRAKTRLAGVLTVDERAGLVLAMLRDVLTALRGLKTIVVSPEELEPLLEGFRFTLLREEGNLNEAVSLANAHAMAEGAEATLFVPGDLPLLRAGHVKEILELGSVHPLILAPARRGGTGILYRRPPDIIRERFTPTSFEDHHREAVARGVELYIYDSFSLSLDLDTPEDLREFMLHGEGTETYRYLEGFGGRFRASPPG